MVFSYHMGCCTGISMITDQCYGSPYPAHYQSCLSFQIKYLLIAEQVSVE